MVRPADIYVLVGLIAERETWTYRSLAARLEVPHSVVQRGLERSERSSLYMRDYGAVNVAHFEEFAIHALRFVAPASLGPLTPGIPAAWAAEPMASAIHNPKDEPLPVWPDPHGRVRGQAIKPLHPSAPKAASSWIELSELLSLVDSLRAGDVRIRKVAGGILAKRLWAAG